MSNEFLRAHAAQLDLDRFTLATRDVAYWLGVIGPCSSSTWRASRSKSESRTCAASPSSDHLPVSLNWRASSCSLIVRPMRASEAVMCWHSRLSNMVASAAAVSPLDPLTASSLPHIPSQAMRESLLRESIIETRAKLLSFHSLSPSTLALPS
jgi:hypothetical protein